MADELTRQDMMEVLVRIDERTASMKKTLEDHIQNDREDFKEVHSRIGRVERKQYWMLGVGAGAGSFIGVLAAYLKNMIGSGGPHS